MSENRPNTVNPDIDWAAVTAGVNQPDQDLRFTLPTAEQIQGFGNNAEKLQPPVNVAEPETTTGRETLRSQSGSINVGGYESEPSQDTTLANDRDGVWIVADGVGGNADGGRASQLAVKTFEQYIRDNREAIDSSDLPPTQLAAQTAAKGVETIIEAFKAEQTAAENPMSLEAATTFSAMFKLPGNKLGIVSIGDSSVFRRRGDKIEQLTEEQGERNIIFNSLSTHRNQNGELVRSSHSKPDQYKVTTPQAGHEFLICSDGLLGDESYQKTPHQNIAEVLAGNPDPQTAAEKLAALPRELQARTGDDQIMMSYTPQADVPKLGWKKGVPIGWPFEAKKDDLAAVVVKFGEPAPEAAAAPKNTTPERPATVEEIIAERPENEHGILEALTERFSSSDNIGPLFRALTGTDRYHSADSLVNLQKDKRTARYLVEGLKDQLRDNPSPQNVLKQVKEILISENATRETVTNDFAALQAAFQYLVEFPDTAIGADAVKNMEGRLGAIHNLLESLESKENQNV
jgi:PPM family protein phosphatase